MLRSGAIRQGCLKRSSSTWPGDQLDIAVDLTGHTSNNRLLAFSQRIAPIQVSWLGYPCTTGLGTIDYRLTDGIADPPGAADSHFSETLVRLPRTFLCYQPPPTRRRRCRSRH